MRSRFRFCSCSDGALLGRGFKLANPVPAPPLAPASAIWPPPPRPFSAGRPARGGERLLAPSARRLSGRQQRECWDVFFFLPAVTAAPDGSPSRWIRPPFGSRRSPPSANVTLGAELWSPSATSQNVLASPCREPPRCCNKKVFVKKSSSKSCLRPLWEDT